MPTVHSQIQSPLPPAEVLRVITDFGPARSQAWPGVDDQHLQVHGRGEGRTENVKGKLIGALLPVVGTSVVSKSLSAALQAG